MGKITLDWGGGIQGSLGVKWSFKPLVFVFKHPPSKSLSPPIPVTLETYKREQPRLSTLVLYIQKYFIFF